MARFISATTLLLAVVLFASAAHAASGLLNSTGSSVNKLDTGLHGECPANQTLIGMLQKYYPTSGIKLPEETQVTNCVTTQDANRNEAYTVSFDMKGVTCEVKLTAAEVNTFNNEFGYDREVARKVLACHFALALKEHEPAEEKKPNNVEMTAEEKKKQKKREQRKRNAENNKQKDIDRANKAQCKSDAAVFAQIKALYVAKHESGAQNYELALQKIALENNNCKVINADKEGGEYTIKLKDKPCEVIALRDIGADNFTAEQRSELETGLDACVKTMTENIARKADKKANKGTLNNAESPVETPVISRDEYIIEDETEEFLRNEKLANASTTEEVNQIEEEVVEEVNQVDEEAVEEVNNEVSAQTAEFDEEKSEDLNTSVDTVQKKKDKKKTPKVIPGDCQNPREMYKLIENMYESKKASGDQLYKLALGSLNMTLKSCTVDDVNQDGGVMKISVKDRSCFVHVHKDHGAEQMNAAQSKQLKEDLDDCLSTMHKAIRAKKTLANQQSKVKRQAKRRNNKTESADTSVVEESSAPVVEEPVVEEPVVTAAATEEANEENDFNIDNTNDAVDIDEEDDDIHRVFDAAEQAGRENNTYGGLQCNNMPHVRYLLRDTAAAVGLALPSDLEITTCKVTTVNDAMIFRFGFGKEECPVVMRLKSGNSEAFASDKSRDEFKKDMKKCALRFTNSECGNHEKMRDAFKQEYVKLGGNADKNFHIERCLADAANQKGGILSMKLDQVECNVRVSAELATNPVTADRTDFTADAQICLNKVKAQAEAKRIADNKAKKENKKAKKAEAKAQAPAPQHSRVGGFSDVTKDNVKEVQKIFAHLAIRKLIKSIIVTKQNVKSVQTQVVAGTNVKAVLSFNGKQCELQVFQPLTAKDAPMKVNVYHDNAAKADGEVFHTTLGHSKFELPNCIDVLPTENAQNMLTLSHL